MKATIKDPQFRSVKDPRDRKTAFEKYVAEVKAQEKDRAKERLAKLRADFGSMLRSHPEIKHYTRWKTARPILEHEAIFRSTDDDNERRQLFEEYIVEKRKANIEHEAVVRKSAMDELVNILKALNLEPYTRWSEAHSKIEANDRFITDEKFRTLSKSDILTAFENHIKSLERQFNDERQREKSTKARRERQNRDRFNSLLQELRKAGKIKAGTLWMDILPEIESDERYIGMLGQSGSSSLELFWDVVEEEERALRLVRNDVYEVLEDRRFEITPETSFSRFQKEMSTDDRTKHIPEDTLSLLFDRLLEKVKRREEEDKHVSERNTRRAIDALRSRIKHLDDPPVQHNSTWEAVRPRIAHLEEFKALESEDSRRQAFDKVIRRLKEKEEDIEREREDRSRRGDRERDRDRDRERDRDRDRDRADRAFPDRERRSKRSSRTPEPDAYEADRRKAMADRERQYRKSGGTGLSPPPRDRRSVENDRSRYSEGRLSYDRERDHERRDKHRERDDDRSYRSRDPRSGSKADELDYGGAAPGSGGRRRRGGDSEDESVGSRKRVKRDRERDRDREKEKVEEEKKAQKEEIAMHSGSEEGEMVED
jgi:pre-mRNA-processing factor 40